MTIHAQQAFGPHSGNINSVQSTANLVNSLLGAGLVALPFCYSTCGVLLATVLMLVSVLACRFSYCLLLYCRQLSSRKTYEDLAAQALGPAGLHLIRWSEASLNLGTTVAYINILADVLSSVAGTLIPPGAEPSRNSFIMGVTMLGALPMALLVRDPVTVSTLSTASVGFCFIFALVMALLALTNSDGTSVEESSLLMWRWDGLLLAFPVMAYGFTAHSDYLSIYADMRQPTIGKMLKVTDSALSVASSLYFLVGVSGYVCWQARTSGDMLRNLGASHLTGARGAYERALKACYGLSILGCIPMMISPFYVLFLSPPGYNALPTHDDGERMDMPPKLKSSKLSGISEADSEGEDGSSSSGSRDDAPLLGPRTSSGSATTTIINPLILGNGKAGLGGEGASVGRSSRRRTAGMSGSRGYGGEAQGGQHGSAPLPLGAAGGGPQVAAPASSTSAASSVTASSSASTGSPFSAASMSAAMEGQTGSSAVQTNPLLAAGNTSLARRRGDGNGSTSSGAHASSMGGSGSAGVSPTHALTTSVGIPSSSKAGVMARQSSEFSAYYLFIIHQPSFIQHAYTVVVVLGLSLVCAVYVPNVELLMGLTGSTSSVVLAYLGPAIILLKLMSTAPELDSKAPTSLMLPRDVREQWAWRKRGAVLLLIFGIVTGVVCTEAVLGAVQEEAAVVQLAQQLVGAEAVAVEAQAAKAKAQEAAAAVAAVEAAAARLNQAQADANSTLSRLQQAAATLERVANRTTGSGTSSSTAGSSTTGGSTGSSSGGASTGKGSGSTSGTGSGSGSGKGSGKEGGGGGSSSSGVGGIAAGITSWVEERKQAAQDTKELKGVEAQLKVVRSQVAVTVAQVQEVIVELDASLAQIQAEAAAAAAAHANSTTLASLASSTSGGGSSKARDRAAQLAGELSKAMNVYSFKSAEQKSVGSLEAAFVAAEANATATATSKPLNQVRSNAEATLTALNQTLTILDRVAEAVAIARRVGKADAEVRRDAAAAMAAALNATTSSALALSITQQVLAASASQEADELVAALTKVANDLQAQRARGAGGGGGSGAKASSSSSNSGNSTSTASSSGSRDKAGAAGAAMAREQASSSSGNSTSGSGGGTGSGGSGAQSGDKAKGDGAAASKQTGSSSSSGTSDGSAAGSKAGSDGTAAAAAAAAASGNGTANAPPPATSALSAEKLKEIQEAVKKLDEATGGALTGAGGAGLITGAAGGASNSSTSGTASGTAGASSASSSSSSAGKGGSTAGSGSSSSGSSSSGGKASSSASASSKGQPSPAMPAAPSAVTEVLKTAVQAVNTAHDSAVAQIEATLNASDSTVAERLEKIADGLALQEKAAGEAAAAAAAAEEATEVAGNSTGSGSSSDGASAEEEEAVAGPVVKVGEDGSLVQLESPPAPPLAGSEAGGGRQKKEASKGSGHGGGPGAADAVSGGEQAEGQEEEEAGEVDGAEGEGGADGEDAGAGEEDGGGPNRVRFLKQKRRKAGAGGHSKAGGGMSSMGNRRLGAGFGAPAA